VFGQLHLELWVCEGQSRSRKVPHVNRNALIDAVVWQTTVLIADLATASGVRSPVAHVAQEVFVELVTELRALGCGRSIIANRFGTALCTSNA